MALHTFVQKALILLIQCYQVGLSGFFGPCCRFIPSCSCYASLSIQRFGILRGCWLSVKRLSRCHPFHTGGWDPVPEASSEHAINPSLDHMAWCSQRAKQIH